MSPMWGICMCCSLCQESFSSPSSIPFTSQLLLTFKLSINSSKGTSWGGGVGRGLTTTSDVLSPCVCLAAFLILKLLFPGLCVPFLHCHNRRAVAFSTWSAAGKCWLNWIVSFLRGIRSALWHLQSIYPEVTLVPNRQSLLPSSLPWPMSDCHTSGGSTEQARGLQGLP